MMEWVMTNWEWIMLGFYTLEKIVKLSPSKKDDIIFDAVIKPVWDKLPFGKLMFSKIKKYVIGFFVLAGGILFAFLSGKSA